MANKIRGEMTVTLGGTVYTLRPDHEALYTIDDATPNGVVELARLAWETRSVPARYIALIICEGIKAHGRASGNEMRANISLERIREMIFEEGVAKVMPAAVAFLVESIRGGVKADEGNAKAAKGKA